MRAVPRSARVAVGGLREGALVVRVTAAPSEGAANAAVLAALAAALDTPEGALRLERGARGRTKTVSAPADAAARLLTLAAK